MKGQTGSSSLVEQKAEAYVIGSGTELRKAWVL